MKHFYFSLVPMTGTAEIFIEMFVSRNKQINFTRACRVDISGDIPRYTDDGDYVKEIVEHFGCNFRSVDWINNTDYLEYIVEKYAEDSIWFATFDKEQFEYIKEKYSNAITVAFNVKPEDKQFMVEMWNIWVPGNQDYEIPEYVDARADYEINLPDIYERDKIDAILRNMNFSCDQQDWEYYERILSRMQ